MVTAPLLAFPQPSEHAGISLSRIGEKRPVVTQGLYIFVASAENAAHFVIFMHRGSLTQFFVYAIWIFSIVVIERREFHSLGKWFVI